MNTEEIIKALRDMAKYPTVTSPRDSEALKAAADLLAQRKYRRGDRLICLETEEYCVIHISGTDRQWVKFPNSYIGVYTNEQVAELFELLPKEPEQLAQQYNATSDHQLMENAQGDLERINLVQTGVGIGKPEQKPVAYSYTSHITGAQGFSRHPMPKFFDSESWDIKPLYTTPPQPEQNLNCKSTQARLATAWGYVKAQPKEPEQEPVLLIQSTECPKCKLEWPQPCEQTASIQLFGECISCRRSILTEDEVKQIQEIANGIKEKNNV